MIKSAFILAVLTGLLIFGTETLIQAYAQVQQQQTFTSLADEVNSSLQLVYSVIVIASTATGIIAVVVSKFYHSPKIQQVKNDVNQLKDWFRNHEGQIGQGVEAAAAMVPQLQQQIETHKATIDSLTQELQQKNDLLTTMKTQIDAMLITSSAGTATATNTATTNSTTLANPG